MGLLHCVWKQLVQVSSVYTNYKYKNTTTALEVSYATMLNEHVRSGLTGQRTRLYQARFDIQRGVFAEYYFGRFRAGLYYFDPFSSDNFIDVSYHRFFNPSINSIF
jgi:hypothetical protein